MQRILDRGRRRRHHAGVHSLPIYVRLHGRAVVLVGTGDAADAKRRLLERAGAMIVDEDGVATLAIVANGDEVAVARLKSRGMLVNVVDRPELCDFTLPAIVDRDPVIVAIGTGGASAGLAKVLRQRLETLVPGSVGKLAEGLSQARSAMRTRWPDAVDRRHALDAALAPGGALDPFGHDHDVGQWLKASTDPERRHAQIVLSSDDPDDLTLRQARLLGEADRIFHDADVPGSILDRARADAVRTIGAAAIGAPGLTLEIRR